MAARAAPGGADGAGAVPARVASGPIAGLSLAGFDAAIEAAGGRSALSDRPVGAVKLDFAPMQASASVSSIVDLLVARGHAGVRGQANVLVVHGNEASFVGLVEALRAWEGRQPAGAGPFFYRSVVLMVNQRASHKAVPFEALRAEFAAGMGGVTHTLIYESAAAPVTLVRAWCVFEAAIARNAGTRLEVVMAPAEDAALCEALARDFDGTVARLGAHVNTARARASVASDEAAIQRVLREELDGGTTALDDALLAAWVESPGRRAVSALDSRDEAAAADAAGRLADFLHARGSHDAAVELYREAVERSRRRNGADHASTLHALYNYATVLDDSRRHREAEPLLRELLAAERRAVPQRPARLAAAVCALGCCLSSLRLLDEARPLLQEGYESCKRVLGDESESKETWDALSALAGVPFREAMLADGNAELRAAKAQEAIRMLRQGVRAGWRLLRPTSTEMRCALDIMGVAYGMLGDTTNAAAFREEAASEAPNLARLGLQPRPFARTAAAASKAVRNPVLLALMVVLIAAAVMMVLRRLQEPTTATGRLD